MATLIRATGPNNVVVPKCGFEFERSEIQQIIGGIVKHIPLKNATEIMIFSFDGEENNLPKNILASRVAKQWIFGDVLLCEKSELPA